MAWARKQSYLALALEGDCCLIEFSETVPISRNEDSL
jgi:hypothetical protein